MKIYTQTKKFIQYTHRECETKLTEALQNIFQDKDISCELTLQTGKLPEILIKNLTKTNDTFLRKFLDNSGVKPDLLPNYTSGTNLFLPKKTTLALLNALHSNRYQYHNSTSKTITFSGETVQKDISGFKLVKTVQKDISGFKLVKTDQTKPEKGD